MSKVTARDVLNELTATSRQVDYSSLSEVESGDMVVYKAGTEHAGMVGLVAGTHVGNNSVDLKVGNATRVDVPLGDVAKIVRQHQP